MDERKLLVDAINVAKINLAAAEGALESFDEAPENNQYDTLEDAGELEDILLEKASKDCEGSYNCGDESYEREFIVQGKHYLAILDVEYNRHDKTYYYVDEYEFRIEEI